MLQSFFSETLHMFKFWRKSLVQPAQKTTLNERLKERQQQIVSVDRAGAALKMNICWLSLESPELCYIRTGHFLSQIRLLIQILPK